MSETNGRRPDQAWPAAEADDRVEAAGAGEPADPIEPVPPNPEGAPDADDPVRPDVPGEPSHVLDPVPPDPARPPADPVEPVPPNPEGAPDADDPVRPDVPGEPSHVLDPVPPDPDTVERRAAPAEPAGPPDPADAAEPAAESAVDPDAESAVEPDAEPAVEPDAGSAVEPDAEPAVESAAEPAVAPGDLPALRAALEAVLMVVDEPVPAVQFAQVLEVPRQDVETALAELAEEYTRDGRGFDLRPVAGGWRFYSRAECAPVVERFMLDGQQARLTQAALETLAVVAYRQPVSRSRVSAVRGVNCDGVIRTLVSRGLLEEAGHEQESGALLYRTTGYFLERLGLQGLDDLPDIAPYLPGTDEVVDPEEVAAPEDVAG